MKKRPTLMLGAPGTGKTHGLVQKILDIKPDRFALVSFTRRAANEAKQRLRNYYAESELKYVRTIHSLCFELLGIRSAQVMSWKEIRQFGNEHGYEFHGRNFNLEDDSFNYLSEDDIEYRKMMTDIAKEDLSALQGDMWNRYVSFKKERHLIDFHDMIIQACYHHNIPKFDLVCVDEIQDLTPIQLNFIDRLARNASRMIYAGDDNQMIFEWAGVDRARFIKLVDNSTLEPLLDNYRIKGEIANLARTIINRCSRIGYSRVQNSRSDVVNVSTDAVSYDMNSKESYLVLVRNGYLLGNIIRELEETGLTYSLLGEENNQTKIKLSTIHAAKGAEADNVILYTDVSPTTFEHLDEDREHRVWYVGVTRARKTLYVVPPTSNYYYGIY